MIGAYILTHVKSGMFYVGSSKDVDKRVHLHWYLLKKGKHVSKVFQQLWDNSPKFDVRTIRAENRDEAFAIEQAIIAENENNPLMINIGLGVYGGDNLTRHPERLKIVEKIADSWRAIIRDMSPEERRMRFGRAGESNPMFGKTHTDEIKAKISAINKGNQYALGSVRSIEQRKALSDFAKTRTGEANPFHGKSHSEETKKLLSEKLKGQLPPNLRPVSVDDVVYPSATEAAKQLGVVTATILFRIKSKNPKFSNYFYVTEMPNDYCESK